MNGLKRNMIAAVLLILGGVMTVYAYDFDDGKYRYRILDETERTCAVEGFKKYYDVDIEIPQTVETDNGIYTVTEIGPRAFEGYGEAYYDEGIYSVKLPSTIQKIGRRAFAKCERLKDINFPESLVEIGDSAFWCPWIRDRYHGDDQPPFEGEEPDDNYMIPSGDPPVIRLSDGVRRIGNGAFQRKYNFRIENLPSNIEEIGDYAFYAIAPVDLTMPPTLRKIGAHAFNDFRNPNPSNPKEYDELIIPEGLTYIGEEAFRKLHIGRVVFPGSLDTISAMTFYESYLNEVVIPEGVRVIGDEAFFDSGLGLLSLPSTLESIGESAFYFADIEELTVPDGVKSIGSGAFRSNYYLRTIKLPEMASIPSSLLQRCSSIENLRIGSNGGIVEEGILEIPEGTVSIGESAFGGIPSIRGVRLPSTVRDISQGNPFSTCKNLERVEIDERNSWYKSEDGVLMTMWGDSLISFPGNRGEEYVVPSGITAIVDGAFKGNRNIERVIFPKGLIRIGNYAFYDCSNLNVANLPTSIEAIGEWAFSKSGIREVILPASLKVVGESCFNDFNDNETIETIRIYGEFDQAYGVFPDWYKLLSVKDVYYLSTQPQTKDYEFIDWGRALESLASADVPLYVLAESYDEIKNGRYNPWSKFKDIRIYNPADDPYYEAYMSSVNGIAADSEGDCEAEYFTLSGIRVDVGNLSPGIYVKRQGTNTEKVLVK